MSTYVDINSIVQVIGGVYKNPSLLDLEEKYFFREDDFTENFHKILFGSIYNLHKTGEGRISIAAIEKYLEARPAAYAIYKTNKGQEYLENLEQESQISAFDYHYNRMKKMSLLRAYNNAVGMDLSWLYDVDNIMNVKKKQAQEEWLDGHSLEEIDDIIQNKIMDIRLTYVDDAEGTSEQAGEGVMNLLESLRETPEIGCPLYGPIINTITRGARLKKFYLRSAATGVGKTRSMIGDACNLACNKLYDKNSQTWVDNGTSEPTIFISTEQELDEIQTMMIAFISDVEEEHILNGTYLVGEWDRVCEASKILSNSPLFIRQLPDFSLKDIENTIKKEIRDHKVKYVFFDYLHTSMKILSEVSSKTGIKGLREDNILFMISIRLKDLCNQYGVFIMSATQLNGDYITAKQYDQNLLRGAKSIADKIDCGMIMLNVDSDDIASLDSVLKQGFQTPTTKISIYKNRRGKYKDVLLWCSDNKGTCKFTPLFVTNYQYELIEIKDLQVKVKERE